MRSSSRRERRERRERVEGSSRRKCAKHVLAAITFAIATMAFALVLPSTAHAAGTAAEPFKSVGDGSWSKQGTTTYDNCYVTCETGQGGAKHVKIVLTGDVTLDDYWYITPNYVGSSYRAQLDLNGHTLQRSLTSKARNGCVIYIKGSSSLSVFDSVGTGKITGGKSKNTGGGIHLGASEGNNSNYDLTLLSLNNVKVTGNESSYGGGGICAEGWCQVSLGGTTSIEGNNADGAYGGGICLDRCDRLFMGDSARVANNSCSGGYGGGIYAAGYTWGWTLGGASSITGNTAKYGGGIYLHDNFITACSEDFQRTHLVSLADDFTVSGNTASEDGGGIYVNNASDLKISGNVSVSGNSAKRGGGMYMNSSFMHDSRLVFESGSPKISGNTSSKNGSASNLQLDARSVRLLGLDQLQEGTSIGLTAPGQKSGQSVVKDKSSVLYDGAQQSSYYSTSGAIGSNAAVGTYFFSDDGAWEYYGVAAKGKGASAYGESLLTAYSKGSGTNPQVTGVSMSGLSGSCTTTVTGDTIQVTVPFGTDLSALKPSFATKNATATFCSQNGSLVAAGGTIDCSSPVAVVVRNENSNGSSYSTTYRMTVTCAEAATHKLSVASGAGYTAQVSAGTVKQGETATATVTPTGGYKLVGWKVIQGGVTLENTESCEVSFTMGDTDVVLEPQMELITYTVKFVDCTGSVYYEAEHKAGDRIYVYPSVPLGMTFTGWTLPTGYEDFDSSYAFDAAKVASQRIRVGYVEGMESGALVFTCGATAKAYPVSVSGGTIVSADGTACADGTTSGNYPTGTELVVRAGAAPAGKKFLQWKITGYNGDVSYASDKELAYTTSVSYSSYRDTTLSFEAEYTEDTSRTLTVDGGTGSGVYEQGESVKAEAVAPAGYTFSRWEASGITLAAGQETTPAITVTMPSDNATLKAVFTPIDYTLSVDGGSIAKVVRDGADATASYGGKLHVGDVVTLKPAGLPAGTGAFRNWEETTSGNKLLSSTGTANEYVLGAGSASVKAVYAYAVLAVGASCNTLYVPGEEVVVTAQPGVGEELASWTVDGASNCTEDGDKGTVSFTMPANAVTVTANLKKTGYTLTPVGATIAKVVRNGADITKNVVGANASSASGLHYGDLVSLENQDEESFFYWTGEDPSTGAAASLPWFTDEQGRDAFVMPATNVELTAHYTYALTVQGGSCDDSSGTYEDGETATITASAGEWQTFTGWTVVSGLDEGSSAYKAIMADTGGSVSFEMPANAVVVSANYEEAPVRTVTLNNTPWAAYHEGEKVTVSVDAEAFKAWAADYKTTLGLADWTQTTEDGYVVVTFTMPVRSDDTPLNLDVKTYTLVNNVDITMDTPTSSSFNVSALNLAASADAESATDIIRASSELVDVSAASSNAGLASLLSLAGDEESAGGGELLSLAAEGDEGAGANEGAETTEAELVFDLDVPSDADDVLLASDLTATYNGRRAIVTVDDTKNARVYVSLGLAGDGDDASDDGKKADDAHDASSTGAAGSAGAAGASSAQRAAAKGLPKTGDDGLPVTLTAACCAGAGILALACAARRLHRR